MDAVFRVYPGFAFSLCFSNVKKMIQFPEAEL